MITFSKGPVFFIIVFCGCKTPWCLVSLSDNIDLMQGIVLNIEITYCMASKNVSRSKY